jgi:hypothetical protein
VGADAAPLPTRAPADPAGLSLAEGHGDTSTGADGRIDEETAIASLILPAYNEARSISMTLARCVDFFRSRALVAEIIVVDDGSKDATGVLTLRSRCSTSEHTIAEKDQPSGAVSYMHEAIALRCWMQTHRYRSRPWTTCSPR